MCVGLLSPDISKAFDCMQYPLPLAKVKAYNFDETKLHILHELRDETVTKFQCDINHFIPPNYYEKNK